MEKESEKISRLERTIRKMKEGWLRPYPVDPGFDCGTPYIDDCVGWGYEAREFEDKNDLSIRTGAGKGDEYICTLKLSISRRDQEIKALQQKIEMLSGNTSTLEAEYVARKKGLQGDYEASIELLEEDLKFFKKEVDLSEKEFERQRKNVQEERFKYATYYGWAFDHLKEVVGDQWLPVTQFCRENNIKIDSDDRNKWRRASKKMASLLDQGFQVQLAEGRSRTFEETYTSSNTFTFIVVDQKSGSLLLSNLSVVDSPKQTLLRNKKAYVLTCYSFSDPDDGGDSYIGYISVAGTEKEIWDTFSPWATYERLVDQHKCSKWGPKSSIDSYWLENLDDVIHRLNFHLKN